MLIAKAIELCKKYRRVIIYSVIGASGATLDFVTFWLITHYDLLHYIPANILTVSLGITNNFLLNAFFNFKTTDQLWRRFVTFYGVGIFGLIVTTICLYVFVSVLGTHELVGKILIVFIAFVLQYGLNKKYSFKETSTDATNNV